MDLVKCEVALVDVVKRGDVGCDCVSVDTV